MLTRFATLLFLLNCTACSNIGTNTAGSKTEHSQLSFITISSIREVPVLVNKFLSENSEKNNYWVIFDVDYTLTMPMLVHENKKYVVTKESLTKAVEDIKDNEKFDRAISATLFFPQILIDERTLEILRALRKDGAKVFALTAAVGSEKHKRIREKNLNSMGVNFDEAFNFSEASLDDIKPYNDQRPSFSHGILYANGERDPNNNKGCVLASFMRKMWQYPACVVVVDDRKRNLEDIEKSLKNTNIKFLGILHNNVKKYNEAPASVLKKHISDVLKNEDV